MPTVNPAALQTLAYRSLLSAFLRLAEQRLRAGYVPFEGRWVTRPQRQRLTETRLHAAATIRKELIALIAIGFLASLAVVLLTYRIAY